MKFRGLFAAWLLLAGTCFGGIYEDGLAAKQAGQHELAARLLGKTVQGNPGNAEAWLHYGTVLGWLQRHDEALAALRRGLAIAPQDFDLQMAEARVLAWQSDYASADLRLAALDTAHPDNTEVLVMRGRVAGWLGDRHRATVYYERVLALDPHHVDALTGLGDLAAESNRQAQARLLYEKALAIDPSPDIQRRLTGLQATSKRRLDFGLTGSTFDGTERQNWWGAYASYGQKVLGWDAWFRFETGNRFGLQDETYEMGAAGSIVEGLQATLYAGWTPDADFSADWYADASLRWRVYQKAGPLGQAWLLAEARHADYATSPVWITRFGWEQQLAKTWTLNARWLHFAYDSGLSADGWVALLTWEPKDRWQLKVGAGRAVESLTNQTLRTDRAMPSWTIFAGLVIPMGEHWQIRLDLEREDVDSRFARYGAAVGLTRFF